MLEKQQWSIVFEADKLQKNLEEQLVLIFLSGHIALKILGLFFTLMCGILLA